MYRTRVHKSSFTANERWFPSFSPALCSTSPSSSTHASVHTPRRGRLFIPRNYREWLRKSSFHGGTKGGAEGGGVSLSFSLSPFSSWRRHGVSSLETLGCVSKPQHVWSATSSPFRKCLHVRVAARDTTKGETTKGCATKGKRRGKKIFRGSRGNSSYPRENSFGSQLCTSRVSLILFPSTFFTLLNCYVSFIRRRRDTLCFPLLIGLSFDASFDSRAPQNLRRISRRITSCRINGKWEDRVEGTHLAIQRAVSLSLSLFLSLSASKQQSH